MQKFLAIIALVALLGVTSAALTNGSYAVGPKEVANVNDTQIVSAPYTRLVSSGSNVLLQGVNGDNITQKTLSTKDLGASDPKNVTQTGFNSLDAAQGVHVYDTIVAAKSEKDKNGVPQVQVVKYKLTASGATNSTPQDITSNTNNASVLTLIDGSGFVHPGTKRYYVAALLQDNSANTTANLILVGVDVSGTSTTRTVLSTNAPLNAHASCAGIAGQKQLYCVFTQDATHTVGAKVDPNTNVTAGDILGAVSVPDGSKVRAWSASNSYGSLVQTGDAISVQSSSNNWTAVPTNLAAGSTIIRTLPRNDLVALLLQDSQSVNVQYLDRNGSANGTAVSLLTDLNNVFSLLQHSDGSLYIGQQTAGQSVVVGQVWGDTHLAASTLQAAVYACFALVAALFVF